VLNIVASEHSCFQAGGVFLKAKSGLGVSRGAAGLPSLGVPLWATVACFRFAAVNRAFRTFSGTALHLLLLLNASCGGSSSETPYPREPEPAKLLPGKSSRTLSQTKTSETKTSETKTSETKTGPETKAAAPEEAKPKAANAP
jgi:hypothetical protein